MTPEQAYERFSKIVRRSASRVADASQGLEAIPLDDRVQEAWVRVLAHLPQIEAATHQKAYVWQLAKNAVRDMAKKIYFKNSEDELSIRERGAGDFGQPFEREDEMLD